MDGTIRQRGTEQWSEKRGMRQKADDRLTIKKSWQRQVRRTRRVPGCYSLFERLTNYLRITSCIVSQASKC